MAWAASVGAGAGSSSGATRLQRPAPAGGPMRVSRPGRGRRAGCHGGRRGHRRRTGDRPQRGERVVGDLTGPDEVPERGEQLVVGGARRGRLELTPEARPPLAEGERGWRRGPRPAGSLLDLPAGGEQRQLVGEAEPDPTVVRPDRSGADPQHVARRAQLVELRRRGSRRRGRTSTSDSSVEATIGAPASRPSASTTASTPAPLRRDAVPRREEAGERLRLDRLDLSAQRGQRPPAQLAQHVAVAPLPPDALGTELAADDAAVGLEGGERAEHAGLGDAETVGDLALGERPVGAGVAGDEVLDRPWHRLGEGGRKPERQGAAETVAVARRVVGGDVAGTPPRRPPRSPASPPPARPASHPVQQPTARSAGRARRRSGRRRGAARRAARRRCAHAGRRRGAAGRARRRRARRGRAARAAPRRRAGRAAGRGRAPAPLPGVRRAGRRPRTCRRRSS